MSTAASAATGLSPFEQLRYAREIIRAEATALEQVIRRLDTEFCRAVACLLECRGSVIVSGIGKAGLIGQKLVATLASTGTRSHFLHPSEAMHGDLGRVTAEDVVLLLSNSGESEEVLRLLPALERMHIPVLAMTGRATSTLARSATVILDLGPLEEACPLGLAPSASTTAMLALGDALALVTSRMRNFTPADFAQFHPGGSLGRKLSKVNDYMRPLERCRVAVDTLTVREVFTTQQSPGRRSGAIMLVDTRGALSGIFTDSDLARLFERRSEGSVDGEIRHVMTQQPRCIASGAMMSEAITLLKDHKLSELPVVDSHGCPVGLIDITDVMSLMPAEAAA